MGRPVLKLKNYKAEDIKALMDGDSSLKQCVRILAVYQVSLGRSSRSLEDIFQVSSKQITNWVHRFDQEGLEGLKDRPGRGRKSRLDQDQKSRVFDIVADESPEDHGYNTATWTGPVLADLILRSFGVSYSTSQVYNILEELGLSHKRGRPTYPEAEPAAQESFKEELKKKC